MLVVNGMDFSYGNNVVLENTSFYLESNTVNYVIGSNNSGKTTLIKLLSGVLPSFNCIMIDDILLNKRNLNRYVRAMGVVLFENRNQFLFDSVLKEMSFPLENLFISKQRIYDRIDDVLSLMNFKSIKYKNVNDLTDIEKVKLSIAISILHKPKVLLLDNPYINLNEKDSNVINKVLRIICRKEHITILVTTNDLYNVVNADKLLVLGDNTIVLQGTVLEVLKQDNKLTRLGINIPIMVDLSIKLGEYGLLDKIILSPDRMVDVLWK